MVGKTGVCPFLQMRKVGLRNLGRTSLGHVARSHAQVLESVCCPSCSDMAVRQGPS